MKYTSPRLFEYFLVFNEESNWSFTKAQLCMWFLASNTFTSFLIVVVDSTRMLIEWICIKCKKDQKKNENIVQIAPKKKTRSIPTTNPHQEIFNEEFKSSSLTPNLNQLPEENKSDLLDNPSEVGVMKKERSQWKFY